MDNETQRLNLQKKLRRNIGKFEGGKSSLNIALIGPTGCGKSSLINTFAASIATDHWHQYATGGAGEDTQNTIRLKSFKGSRYGADWDTEGYALPTLVDLTGFADEDTAIIEEILRLIFYGKIKDDSNINAIFSFAKDWGIEALQTKYALTQTSDERTIDRAIFVASAMEEIPKNLIRCFLKAAQPKGRYYTRAIPVFGILTHADLASQQIRKFENLEGNFIRALGMIGFKTRYMKCSNYCDDVDPELTRMEVSLPELDIPVLKFMVEVCDRSYDISNPNQTYTQTLFARIAGQLKSTVNISCIRMFIYLVLYTIVMMVFSAMVLLSVK